MDGAPHERLVDDRARNVVGPHDVRRRPHHLLRHLGEQERRLDGERETARRRQRRDAMAKVLAREADVARLFRHVDAHHALHERVHVVARAERLALRVVDRLLAAEHEEEEQLRERPTHPRDPSRSEPVEPAETGHVETDAHEQLVEHERVLRFLDDLVIRVAKLRRVVGERRGEAEQALLQHALELEAELQLRRDQMEAEARARRLRQAAIPRGRAERTVGRKLPARIRLVDRVARRIPVDVGVRVEVLRHREAREPSEERGVRFARALRSLVLRDVDDVVRDGFHRRLLRRRDDQDWSAV
jgi:hypothetical protein